MTIIDGLAIFLLVFVTLVLGIPALVKRSRNPKVASSDRTTRATTVAEAVVDTKPLWGFFSGKRPLYPIVLWVAFWTVLLWYFPLACKFMWSEQLLFWTIQIIYGVMVYKGIHMVNCVGRPEMPIYPQLLLFAIGCLIVTQYGIRLFTSAPSVQSAEQKQVTISPKSSAAPRVVHESTEQSTASLPTFTSVLTAYPEDVTNVPALIIPAGYHLQSIDEFDKVTFVQEKLDDGTTKVVFTTVGTEPIQIKVLCEA